MSEVCPTCGGSGIIGDIDTFTVMHPKLAPPKMDIRDRRRALDRHLGVDHGITQIQRFYGDADEQHRAAHIKALVALHAYVVEEGTP